MTLTQSGFPTFLKLHFPLRRTPPVLAMGLHRRPSSPKSKYASAWQPGAFEFPQWENTWESTGSLAGIHKDSLNSTHQSQRHSASSRSCESLHGQRPTGGHRYYGSLKADSGGGEWILGDHSRAQAPYEWSRVEGDECNGRAMRRPDHENGPSAEGYGFDSVCRCALAM